MRRESVARVAVLLAFAASIVGFVSASTRFFSVNLLQSTDESARVLEESFSASLHLKLSAAKIDNVAVLRDVGDQLEHLKAARNSHTSLLLQQRRHALIDVALWTLTSVLSATALFAQQRKAAT